MPTSIFDQWPQAGKFSMEPFLELNSITMRLFGELAKHNVEAFRDMMQSNAEQWQGLSHAKGWEDILSAQARWTNKTAPQMYQHAQQMLDVMLEGASEYTKWMEKGMHQCSKEVAKNFSESAKSSQGKKHDH